ncbi:MAG: hypothetical protein ACLRH1_05500 [Acutalibacteraceae bacterium]
MVRAARIHGAARAAWLTGTALPAPLFCVKMLPCVPAAQRFQAVLSRPEGTDAFSGGFFGAIRGESRVLFQIAEKAFLKILYFHPEKSRKCLIKEYRYDKIY